MEKNLEEIEIIKNMPLAFAELEMIYDEKGLAIDYKYLNVNDKFSKLTGWEKEDIENKLVTEVYPDVHHNRILYYQQLFEGKEFLDYNSYFPKKNSWYHIKAYKTKRNTFITLFYDVSKLKKANQKLQYMLTHHKYSKILNYEGLMQRLKIFKNINNAICFVITIKNTDNIHSFHGFEFLNNLYKQIVDEFKSYYEGVHLVAHTSYNQIILLIMNPSEKELEKLFSYAKFNIYKSYLVNNYEINIKKNIGYALLKENNTLEMLIQNASVANIFASASEHSQLVEYNEALEEKAIENAKITQSLYRSIKEDNIEIYFQKIVDSKTGKTEYVEALSRCVCKDLGFISPEVLFGMALKSGMNDLLDEYIIEKTFRIFQNIKKEMILKKV